MMPMRHNCMAATQWLYSPVSTNASEKTGILEIACCEMRNLARRQDTRVPGIDADDHREDWRASRPPERFDRAQCCQRACGALGQGVNGVCGRDQRKRIRRRPGRAVAVFASRACGGLERAHSSSSSWPSKKGGARRLPQFPYLTYVPPGSAFAKPPRGTAP